MCFQENENCQQQHMLINELLPIAKMNIRYPAELI